MGEFDDGFEDDGPGFKGFNLKIEDLNPTMEHVVFQGEDPRRKHMSDERKEIYEQICQKTKTARDLIGEAERLADEHGISFGWDLAYGMGGWYTPRTQKGRDWLKRYDFWKVLGKEQRTLLELPVDYDAFTAKYGTNPDEDSYGESEVGWKASSHSC